MTGIGLKMSVVKGERREEETEEKREERKRGGCQSHPESIIRKIDVYSFACLLICMLVFSLVSVLLQYEGSCTTQNRQAEFPHTMHGPSQHIIHNPSLRVPSQVILGCVKLIIKNYHHIFISRN